MRTDAKKKNEKSKKLSIVILEYLILSALISGFIFFFLYGVSDSIAENYFLRKGIQLTDVQVRVLHVWLRSICGFAGIIVFVILFLFMLGQRLSYLIQIIQGVEKLQENKMDHRIPLEGMDELTRLAETINYLSASQRELNQKETQMKEEREAWIRSLSHDIRTPLTSMISYSEFVLEKKEPDLEEMKNCIALIHTKSIQIKELTDQLMGRNQVNWEPVEDVGFLFSQLAKEWQEILEDRFQCGIRLESMEGMDGLADIYVLRRIVDNLASNVEKYADDSQPVKLEIQEEDRTVSIIQSNGIRTGEGPARESHKIGLSNIQKLAALYGGTVEIKEEDCQFQIRISLYIRPLV